MVFRREVWSELEHSVLEEVERYELWINVPVLGRAKSECVLLEVGTNAMDSE